MSDQLFDLVLSIDGTEKDRQEVQLIREPDASDSATLEWATQSGDAGDYTAEVVAEGQTLSESVDITVEPPFTSAYAVASLASFSGTFGVGVFERPGGALQYEVEENEDVDVIAATADTLLYVKRSTDTEIQRADPITGTVKNTYTQASDQINAADVAITDKTEQGNQEAVSYGGDGADIYVHNPDDDSLIYTLTHPTDAIEDLDSHYKFLAAVDNSTTVYVYDVTTGDLVGTVSPETGFYSGGVALGPDYLAVGEDGVTVYDNTFSEVYTLNDVNETVESLEMTKGVSATDYLLAGTNDSGSGGEVWVWNLSDGSAAFDYSNPDGPTAAVSAGPENFRYSNEATDSNTADTVVERSLADGSIQDEFDLPLDYNATDASSF